jgi:alpha-N-acetylglucosamine transferase
MNAAQNNFSYISVLITNDYVDGILVLYHSLKSTKPNYPFLLLISDTISTASRDLLTKHGIEYKPLRSTIANPTNIESSNRWKYTYSKLDIFGQTEFKKIVYLDADMLILRNIDELFEKPHMSAVNAGGMIPELSHWDHLNSGLMVIEPSSDLYSDMIEKVGKIEKVERGGDQDFLQAYYPEWVKQKELHLDHQYNIFNCHLDEYRKLGYVIKGKGKPVKVIHYIGGVKPWEFNMKKYTGSVPQIKRCLKKIIRFFAPVTFEDELLLDSVIIWIETYKKHKIASKYCS